MREVIGWLWGWVLASETHDEVAMSGGARLEAGSMTAQSILSHALTGGKPQVSLVVQPARDGPERLVMAKRLIEAWHCSKKSQIQVQFRTPEQDLWTQLVEKEFQPLIRILDASDAAGLRKYLLHFGEKYVWFGGLSLSDDGYNPKSKTSDAALSYLDKLVCLAESLGVLSIENPEQPVNWGKNIHSDIDMLVHAIETEIGIRIAPPVGAVPMSGIPSKRGPLHYRHFNALHAALRIRSIVGSPEAVCEYGGGLGIVACYAHALGFRDYTLLDLPLVNVLSGNYLMNTLGQEAVCLFGEDAKPDAVKVIPYWLCAEVPDDRFALSLNQDSFPEIDPGIVHEYLRQIERSTRRFFLSINHESQSSMGTRQQNSVPQLMKAHAAYHRLYRMKYWIREGYAEELYELK